MNNKNLLIWVSDLSLNTGEGILAREFLNEIHKLTNYKKIIIKTFEQTIHISDFDIKKIHLKEFDQKNICHKYFGPIYGAIFLRFFSRKYEIIYLNYLPFWNFLIFLILPRKTILGPITGGLYRGRSNNLNLFIRKYFFPLFYNISKIIISIKFNKVIFSTSILKNYIKKNKNNLYNFVTILFDKKIYNNKKKKYDIIFYNRDHDAKHFDNVKKILIYLSKYCKICIIGDIFKHPNVKNFGWIERESVFKIIQQSKIAFNSSENFLSIFGIDCVNYGIPVISDSNVFSKAKFKSKFYIRLDYNNLKKSSDKILNLISQNIIKQNSEYWNNIFLEKKKIRNFLYLYLLR
jgi:hypothetical protein